MSAKYRDRLLDAAIRFADAHDGRGFCCEKYLGEVDAIMLEISEREDTILQLLRRVIGPDDDTWRSVIDRSEAERNALDFLKAKP